jgi:hypothetical protein
LPSGRKPGETRGRKAPVITEPMRQQVLMLTAMGATQTTIARGLKISVDGLQRHYRYELDNGISEANSKVAGALFKSAMGGNVTAGIWWEKTRAGKREVSRHEHSGVDGAPITTFDLSGLTPDDRKALAPVLDKLIAAAGGSDDNPGEAQ